MGPPCSRSASDGSSQAAARQPARQAGDRGRLINPAEVIGPREGRTMAAPWCGPICTKGGAARRCVRCGSGCDDACLVPGKGQALELSPPATIDVINRGVSRMQNEGVLDYSLSDRRQKGPKSIRNGGFSTRNSGRSVRVWGQPFTRQPAPCTDQSGRPAGSGSPCPTCHRAPRPKRSWSRPGPVSAGASSVCWRVRSAPGLR